MRFKSPVLCAAVAALLSPLIPVQAGTIVKVLHINPLPATVEIWKSAGEEYEKATPGVKVEWDYLENEAFKAKLPTLLQSKDRPSIFHSWGGGVMAEQVSSGICQDITEKISEGGFKDAFYPAAVDNFRIDGKYYGVPNDVSPMVLFYNKELLQKAGVDPAGIKYWEDFVEAVKKVKAAGITPIAAGGKDKWPLHFYPALLLMRILGHDGLQAAVADKDGGFTNPEAVKAFKMYEELARLEPFQKGYLANTYPEASGVYHDGGAAFHLMGIWDDTEGRANAADKKGLPREKVGWMPFPEVKGGKGTTADIFASLNGWLVTKEAPPEAIGLLKVWLGQETQSKIAAAGLSIPPIKGTADSIQNPTLKEIAKSVETASWLQPAMDQVLGPDTGRVFNDECADIASGKTTGEEAAKAIEESWQQNKE